MWIIATGNAHKADEIGEVITPFGVEFGLPRDIGVSLDPEEWGETFAENAVIKALAFADATGRTCLADDSGLEVDALGGAPGVYSARWAGEPSDDARNNAKLVRALADVPEDQRSARFRCVIAIAMPAGHAPAGTETKEIVGFGANDAAIVGSHYVCTFDGACEGTVSDVPKGDHGFGYDPHFVTASGRYMAELVSDEKHAISHRGAALVKVRAWLEASR